MRRTLLAFTALISLGVMARAQAPSENGKTPTNFIADDVQYDREAGIVTATGHVEAWQNDRTLRADRITFDRNTGLAAASGNVVLQEPDGQIMFSDYAELTQDMKSGILAGLRTLLAQNGRMVANGARRTDARLNELTRAVYTTCNLCQEDPTRAPLWDIRAREAVQDLDNKRIEYRDAVIDIYGVPVLYTPFLTHPDPTAKRASGLLVPSFGFGSKHLGVFTKVPYYVVIDDQSDVILTPMVTAKAGQSLFTDFRQRFNTGKIIAHASIANDHTGNDGHIFLHGDFALSDIWTWGFDINRASNSTYLRNFGIQTAAVFLGSTIYVEGYGQGSYARTDVRTYQSVIAATATSRLPTVLPRTQYSFVGQPDAWGGRLSVATGAFNVIRDAGTTTQRADLQLGWRRPFKGPVGDLWTVSLNVDSAAYAAHGLTKIPNYAPISRAVTQQAMPTLSIDGRWPLVRTAGNWGSQVVEPIVKLSASPRSRSYADGRIPNEDSLDFDFTDANLFERNRFTGIDRMEGGLRAAVGLHAAWMFPGGAQVDGLFGQSYRDRTEQALANSTGLRGTVSDYVGRISLSPVPWLDITNRERFDHDTEQVKLSDTTLSVGDAQFGIGAGYIYSSTSPYNSYDSSPTDPAIIAAVRKPRHEIALNGRARIDENWRSSAKFVRDLRLGKVSLYGMGATYEDECFIFDVSMYRRYTSMNSDHGDSGLLFNITLKSVGEFGFHAN